jgi:hypothetical protein
MLKKPLTRQEHTANHFFMEQIREQEERIGGRKGSRYFPAAVVGLALSCCEAFPEIGPCFGILADALDDLGKHAAAHHCRGKVPVRAWHVVRRILDGS